MTLGTVLVVDDQEQARTLLGEELAGAGFDVTSAADGDEGWERFCTARPDVVLTDLQMPRCDGIELVRRIRSRSDVPVIVFTSHGSVSSSAHAFKAGADDFISSLDVGIEDLVSIVREAAEAPGQPADGDELARRIAGTSRAANRVRWQIAGLAPLDAPVLVSGDPGTGRTTAVRALHELGSTGDGELEEIESAGFSLGDYRKAQAARAAGGLPGARAIHLEDVEHLGWAAQGWWAAQLESTEPRGPGDPPRLFASTSAPLASLVRSGAFHPDLGRVLLRFQIELPPLRERSEDVEPIAKALLARIGAAVGRGRIQLSPAALRHLERGRFPENVRQLERLLERAAAYSPGRTIRRQALQDLMVDLEDSVASMRDERVLLERERLLRTLQETGGNITRTAEILGKSRAAIYRLIEKHDIPLTRKG